ncbi:MAG: hypothetical protein H0U92_04935 [Actinobacteria bacterium]|nr:hypothetical protein [Actinomycetota bacterium]
MADPSEQSYFAGCSEVHAAVTTHAVIVGEPAVILSVSVSVSFEARGPAGIAARTAECAMVDPSGPRATHSPSGAGETAAGAGDH